MLEQLLKIADQTNEIALTGILRGQFYQTVFIQVGLEYAPFLIMENGEYFEVKSTKTFSYVTIEEKKYIYNTGEPLWFNRSLVSGISRDGVRMSIENSQIEPRALYEALGDILDSYYDFFCGEEKDIVIAHIIHSYLLGLFGKTFYLLLDGEKGTGKSNLQFVLSLLQMNGCFCGKSSIPSIVRKINSLMASSNLDELDKIDQNSLQTLVGVMNTGLYRSGTYEIVDMNQRKSEGQIKVYRTFSTKTFSTNKAKFPDSFLSRCIVINTVRNRRPVKDVYTRTDEDDEQFQAMRDKAFAYCLKNGRSILEATKKKQSEFETRGTFGRRADIFAIICGILDMFKGESQKVQDYLMEKDQMSVEDNEDRDRHYLVLEYFCKRIETGELLIPTTPHEIAEHLRTSLGLEENDRFSPSASSIGSLLKRAKIVSSKKERRRDTTGKRGGKGRYYYEIEASKIKDIILRSEYAELIERIKKHEDFKKTSLSSPNSEGLSGESLKEVFGEGVEIP